MADDMSPIENNTDALRGSTIVYGQDVHFADFSGVRSDLKVLFTEIGMGDNLTATDLCRDIDLLPKPINGVRFVAADVTEYGICIRKVDRFLQSQNAQKYPQLVRYWSLLRARLIMRRCMFVKRNLSAVDSNDIKSRSESEVLFCSWVRETIQCGIPSNKLLSWFYGMSSYVDSILNSRLSLPDTSVQLDEQKQFLALAKKYPALPKNLSFIEMKVLLLVSKGSILPTQFHNRHPLKTWARTIYDEREILA